MRIAVLAPCWFAVPPTGYGGIEWVVSLLADGLVDGGHDVTLFASGDSHTKAKLAAVFPVAPSEWIGRSFWELRHVLHCFERADEFDVINDHSGPFARRSRRGDRHARRAHRARAARRRAGRLYDQVARVAPQTGADLALDEPAQAAAGLQLDRELSRTRSISPSIRSGRNAATTCSSSAA